MIAVLKAMPIVFAAACCALDRAVAAEDQYQAATFTGLYRIESRHGRPENVRITDGKTYVDITEQEYRERGYSPPYERLLTRIIRRLPVRVPVPTEGKE
jgi:hypothetical protein